MKPPPTILQPPADLRYLATLTLPWSKPPLSLNDSAPASRGAVYAQAGKRREVRDVVRLIARQVRMPEGAAYLWVQLNYRVPDRRRRDTDNTVALLKPICDMLAAGTKKVPGVGLVPDDTPRYMGKPEPILWPPVRGERGALWVDLWVASGPPEIYKTAV